MFEKRSPERMFIPAIEKETRRKIWWGVYTLDRMLALALGRPIGAEDADCDVELPIGFDDDFLPDFFAGAPITSETPSLMTGFTSLISLYRIAGRVMRQAYGVDMADSIADPEKRAQLQVHVDALDKDLTKWLDNLPSVFKSKMNNDKQVSMGAALCSHYYSVLTALHRNLLPVRRGQPPAPRSSAKAVSSARTCIRLAPFIKNVVPPSHHLAFFIQHLFTSAVIILLYAIHVADPGAANSAMEEVQSCLAALGSFEGHWPGAQKVKELLVELMTAAREGALNNQATNATVAPMDTSTNMTFTAPSIPFDKGQRDLSPDAGRPSTFTQASAARQYVIEHCFRPTRQTFISFSYVQELEALLLHMESRFAHVTQRVDDGELEGILAGSTISHESRAAATALLRSIINKGQTFQQPPVNYLPTPSPSPSMYGDIEEVVGSDEMDEGEEWVGW
jgi:hypothetical protein